jgi:hypothetical protein
VNPAAGHLWPGSLLWSIVAAGWVWILALLLGAGFVALPGKDADEAEHEADSRTAAWIAWSVIGIALQSWVWLLLSALGLLRPVIITTTAIALTVVGVVMGGRRVGGALRVVERFAGLNPSKQEPYMLRATALGVLVIAMIVTLRFALIPSVYYDDLVYHLGLPRQALLTGSWPSLPLFYHSFMPAAWEITYVLPLSLGGGSGPQLMNVVALGLLGAIAYRLARLGGGPAASLSVTAMLLASSMFVGLGSLAGNDLFPGLALCVGFERAIATSGRRPILVGLLAGAAGASKFIAAPAILALGIAVMILSSGSAAKRLLSGAAVWIVAAVVGLGWTVRAFLITGNPVYPAFFRILGGQGWDAQAASLLTRDAALGAFPSRGVSAFFLAPIDVVRSAGAIGTPGGINLCLVALAVVGMLLASRLSKASVLVMFVTVTYVGWAATTLAMRFALVVLVGLLPFACALLQRALDLGSSHPRRIHAGAAAILMLIVAPSLVHAVKDQAGRYGNPTRLPALIERSSVLETHINLAAAGSSMADVLDADARVLVVGDARLALLPRVAVLSTAVDRPVVARLLEQATTAAELRARLALEFTHVVVNFRELQRWTTGYAFNERLGAERDRAKLDECFRSLIPIGRWGDVVLFDLREHHEIDPK